MTTENTPNAGGENYAKLPAKKSSKMKNNSVES